MAKRFPLSIAVGAVDNVSAPMRAIVGRTGALMSGLQRRVGGPFSRLGANPAFRNFGASLAGATTSARAFGAEGVRAIRNVGFAAVGAGAALYGIANATAKAGDNAAKTAAKLGVGVEALQEYRFAADRSGVSTQAFDMALLQLGRQAGEAAKGQGQAVDAFSDLGVSLTDQEGKLRSVEELMPLLADGLSKVEDETKRNAIAARIFGVRGIGMVNVLAGGSKGLAELRGEARRYGLVIGEDAARASEAFVDSQTNLTAALAGTRNRIGSELIPVLTRFQDKIAGWLSGNGPKITAWAKSFADKLPQRLESLRAGAENFWAKAQPLVELGKGLVEHFGAFQVVGGAVALLMGGKLLTSSIGMVGALSKLTWATVKLGIAVLANPVGLWITGITLGVAGLVAIGYYLVKNWDSIADWFGRLWEKIKDVFAAGSDWIAAKLSGLTAALPWWVREGINLVTGGGSSDSAPTSTTSAAVDRIASSGGGPARQEKAEITLRVPPGIVAEQTGRSAQGPDVNLGYSMLGTG